MEGGLRGDPWHLYVCLVCTCFGTPICYTVSVRKSGLRKDMAVITGSKSVSQVVLIIHPSSSLHLPHLLKHSLCALRTKRGVSMLKTKLQCHLYICLLLCSILLDPYSTLFIALKVENNTKKNLLACFFSDQFL